MRDDSIGRSEYTTTGNLKCWHFIIKKDTVERKRTPIAKPWQRRNCQYCVHWPMRNVAATNRALEERKMDRKYPRSNRRPTTRPGRKVNEYWIWKWNQIRVYSVYKMDSLGWTLSKLCDLDKGTQWHGWCRYHSPYIVEGEYSFSSVSW